jgi:hypothetical protein
MMGSNDPCKSSSAVCSFFPVAVVPSLPRIACSECAGPKGTSPAATQRSSWSRKAAHSQLQYQSPAGSWALIVDWGWLFLVVLIGCFGFEG